MTSDPLIERLRAANPVDAVDVEGGVLGAVADRPPPHRRIVTGTRLALTTAVAAAAVVGIAVLPGSAPVPAVSPALAADVVTPGKGILYVVQTFTATRDGRVAAAGGRSEQWVAADGRRMRLRQTDLDGRVMLDIAGPMHAAERGHYLRLIQTDSRSGRTSGRREVDFTWPANPAGMAHDELAHGDFKRGPETTIAGRRVIPFTMHEARGSVGRSGPRTTTTTWYLDADTSAPVRAERSVHVTTPAFGSRHATAQVLRSRTDYTIERLPDTPENRALLDPPKMIGPPVWPQPKPIDKHATPKPKSAHR